MIYDDLPIKKWWFPIATLNNQTVKIKAGRNKYNEKSWKPSTWPTLKRLD